MQTRNNNPKIVFLGTAAFAVPFLQTLVARGLKPMLVVTRPDRPAGRNQTPKLPPLKLPALAEHIEVAQPSDKKHLHAIIEQAAPDICILVAYGMLIPPETLTVPTFGFINVHPSLLPRYRGPSPVQTAILNGDESTGVTLIKLDGKMDHGPIIAQTTLPILATDNNATLHDRLALVGAELLVTSLPAYLAGELQEKDQDEASATYTRIITRQDGLIDWSKSSKHIQQQSRAFSPWPGVFTHWQKKRLKIANLDVLEGYQNGSRQPGEVFLTLSGALAVQCGSGAVVLKRLQLEGKNEVNAADFLRGYQTLIGSTLIR